MGVTILTGDVRERLAKMPGQSVHCCVTSPPYWGMRDYGVDGQIGLEPTLDAWVETMVAVFREVRRVLRDDGTLWLNLGDGYAGSWGAQSRPDGNDNGTTLNGGSMLHARQIAAHPRGGTSVGSIKRTPGLKPKDLMMMPARVALALQADGWWLRSEIVWEKANPMPESVSDRPTSAHEKIFLLSKNARYFYDADAIREPWADGREGADYPRPNAPDKIKSPHGQGFTRRATEGNAVARPPGTASHKGLGEAARKWRERNRGGRTDGFTKPNNIDPSHKGGRNKRNVWTIATEPFPEGHFAVFPTALIEPCIKAGTSEHGCCSCCGAPWRRIVEKRFEPQSDVSTTRGIRCADGQKPMDDTSGWDGFARGATRSDTIGWEASCDCPPVLPLSRAVILDPFGGAGTTGLVADRLQRDAILIELNPEYAVMARERIRADGGIFATVAVA